MLQIEKYKTEDSNHVKPDFSACMSHELCTQLTAIIGFSELMKDKYVGKLNEKHSNFVKIIWGSGKNLIDLINDILYLSEE